MYQDPVQWQRIRRRVLVAGESRRQVARTEGVARSTLRKMLTYERPPGYGGRERRPTQTPTRLSAKPAPTRAADRERVRWMEWLYARGYTDITPEALPPGLLGAGLPRDYAEFLLLILGHFKAGHAERTTDAVQQVTGQAPRSFEQYAQDYRASWA